MTKFRKPTALTLSTQTVRALQTSDLLQVGGAMKPKKTITLQVGCGGTSNETVLC
jgi:hypothetical protein